jgi:AcrR family transcriptional regulator
MSAATPAVSARRRRREKGPRTRRQILEASKHLFSRNGYPGTTVRDIAREAGITDAAIYYHFRTKDDLFHELLGADLESLHRAAGGRQDETLDQALRTITQHAVQLIDVNKELLRIILREALAGDATAGGRYRALLDRWEARVNARLHPFEARGSIARGSSEDLSRHVVYTIAMAVQDRLLLGRGDRDELMSFLSSAVRRLTASRDGSTASPANRSGGSG